jgi:DNA-binding transcriptional regulator YdaS (Cro superfamily)
MKPIEVAIEKFAGVAPMAVELGASVQAIYKWRDGSRRVPAELCPAIEERSDVACELLRPDVKWHVLRGKPRPELAAAGPSEPAISTGA